MKTLVIYTSGAALSVLIALACWFTTGASESSRNAPRLTDNGKPTAVRAAPPELSSHWNVSCPEKDKNQLCSVSQELWIKKDNQRLVQFEVGTNGKNLPVALITLPFGLSVSRGINVAIDKINILNNTPFSTCLPQGCLVQFDIDKGMLEAMRNGRALMLISSVPGKGDVRIEMSLNGFNEGFSFISEQNKQRRQNSSS